MKTTLVIPDDLMKAIKMRAVQEGRKLNDLMPELLLKGLLSGSNANEKAPKARISVDKATGLPVILGGTASKEPLTPLEMSNILLGQEVASHRLTS
jgi:hypothetical protein